MAEAPKPARKPAKRGPTKAAALKALGLTQAELDLLKASAQELAALKADASLEVDAATMSVNEPRPEEIQRSIQEANFQKFQRSDPQAALEDRPAPQQVQTQVPEPAAMVWYIRNLRHVEVGFRLTRQQDTSKRRTDLKPRGQRGDMVKLEPGDLRDPELQTQVAFELVEVIPEGEALAAISKQYTNTQQNIPAHIASLRNALGQEYAQANPVTIASDDEAYGIAVQALDPRLMQGQLTDQEIQRGAGFAQPNLVGPTQNPQPGRIINDGFMAPAQTGLGLSASDNERAAQIDALARSKQFEGPGAGVGEVTVKVEPVRRQA